MDSLITRRKALKLAFAAVPGAVALAAAQPLPALAASGALVATQATGAETALGAGDSTEPVGVELAYSDVDISARGKVKGSGWAAWCDSGATVGKTNGKGLVSLRIKLEDLQELTGDVQYQVYKRGSGWQPAKANGKATATVQNIEAVKVTLAGAVAAHYDVLYRVYMSGSGWGKWVKNGTRAGTLRKGRRVNALQVKLSPKTQEALGEMTDVVGVRCAAYVRKTGWKAWVAAGKTAGTTGKARPLGGFSVMADAGLIGGGCRYRAYLSGVGWKGWKTDGKFAGSTSRNLEAVSIELTGALAESYDVYYRTHVSGYGWLDWAKNGAEAGGAGYAASVEALQVRLVKVGAAAPGATDYPTVNALESRARLDGIDISSHQAGIDVAKVPADFVIVKATQGNWYTNPYFTQHAKATLASGKLLGTYHFADLRGSAKEQADYYVAKVKSYIGECLLILDWEADALSLGPTWAKKFLDRVYKKTGVKPLIYLSQSQTKTDNWAKVAVSYKLWVAQYARGYESMSYLTTPEGGTDIGYWSEPVMYQYTSSGQLSNYSGSLDLNKFYGSAAVWKQLCNGA